MLLNKKQKILYVAVPKTATTAIQNWLISEDSNFKKGRHSLKGKDILLKEHITAFKAKELLGGDYYNQLNVIAFIRHPYSKMISSYNFYRGGGKQKSSRSKGTKNVKERLLHIFQFQIARILPFFLWALIYPYKDNKSYCVDNENKIIVSHIGLFEDLLENLTQFTKELHIKADIDKLKYLNISKKKSSIDIIKNSILQHMLVLRHKRLKADLKFYQDVLQKNQN